MAYCCCDMYGKSALFFLIFFTKKTVFCNLLGLEKEETTRTPMDISMLNYVDYCKFQPNGYDCGEKNIRKFDWFYFDLKMEDCIPLPVTGDCLDNKNAFSTSSNCKTFCRDVGKLPATPNLTKNVFCRMQFDFGDCNEYNPMWYFDVSSRTCKGFSYSGCGGNQNKFKTAQDCTTACVPNVEYNKEF